MTSPSAAHTGIGPAPSALVPTPIALLVDVGLAAWCPACVDAQPVVLGPHSAPYETIPRAPLGDRTCVRCGGAQIDPFHGCTFLGDQDGDTPPCACTGRCRVWAANRHGQLGVASSEETPTT